MYTPLYTALLELYGKNRLSFHMPGHLDGRALEGFDRLTKIDTTELPESDNLFHPEGAIAEAQRAAARFFGARETRFLVNGSSGGILAMVTAAVGEGQKIVCDRFCHRSFISALIQSGAVPVWVRPKVPRGGALWGGIDPEDVRRALSENPDAAAVYITSPNYFGYSCDVEKIAEIAHGFGAALLVDGAHGAHYGLSPLLPPSAVSLGADLTVVSAHKTLPALTQTAYLHINGSFPKLDYTLRQHQTSSPSYILMASLDYTRAMMEEKGEALWTAAAQSAMEIFPEQSADPADLVKYRDPCRLVLPVRGNPFKAAEILRRYFGISVECSYGGGLICIVSCVHRPEELKRLREAWLAADSALPEAAPIPIAPTPRGAVLTPRQAFMAPWEEVPLSKAVGRVCAQEVVVYPPGTASLVPGETVPPELPAELKRLTAMGGEVHGLVGGKIRVTLR